jgi:hypothetical protein
MRKTATKTWARSIVFAAVITLVSTLHAGDDTSRFFGTWKATSPYNGQTVTMVSFHDRSGYKNYFVLPSR